MATNGTCNGTSHSEQLEAQVASMLCAYLQPHSLAEGPVVKLASPQELEEAFADAGCALRLTENEAPLSREQMLAAVRLTLEYSVKTGGPGML